MKTLVFTVLIALCHGPLFCMCISYWFLEFCFVFNLFGVGMWRECMNTCISWLSYVLPKRQLNSLLLMPWQRLLKIWNFMQSIWKSEIESGKKLWRKESSSFRDLPWGEEKQNKDRYCGIHIRLWGGPDTFSHFLLKDSFYSLMLLKSLLEIQFYSPIPH